MLKELIKLAYQLEAKEEYELARDVDMVVAELVARTGLNREEMTSLANYFDEQGDYESASKIDNMILEAAKKTDKVEENKKPPKGWVDVAKEKVKKKSPEYANKKVNEAVGDLWDKMSDAAKNKACKEYDKKAKK